MISSVRVSPACVTVLVIPDVHLKPWMFDRASDLMKEKKADRAVCLMDIADDWNQSLNIDLYNRTYERAIRFAAEYDGDIDQIIAAINSFGSDNLWQDISPIWLRPQHSVLKMYKPGVFLQVVGHTPVESVERKGNLISCDVFSTDDAGRPIGSQEFPVIDTIHWDYGVYR